MMALTGFLNKYHLTVKHINNLNFRFCTNDISGNACINRFARFYYF